MHTKPVETIRLGLTRRVKVSSHLGLIGDSVRGPDEFGVMRRTFAGRRKEELEKHIDDVGGDDGLCVFVFVSAFAAGFVLVSVFVLVCFVMFCFVMFSFALCFDLRFSFCKSFSILPGSLCPSSQEHVFDRVRCAVVLHASFTSGPFRVVLSGLLSLSLFVVQVLKSYPQRCSRTH